MAFPARTGTPGTGTSVSAPAHAITLPTGLTQTEGCLVVVSADSAPTQSTTSTGWVLLEQGSAGTVGSGLFYKAPGVAVGALSVDLSFAEEISFLGQRISGASTAAPEWAVANGGTETDADSPSLTPTGGAQDYLWLAVRTCESANVATAAPTNYTDLITVTGGSSGASTQLASRSLNAATEDPDAWTDPAEDWVAWTIAIPPAVAAAAVVTAHRLQNPARMRAATR